MLQPLFNSEVRHLVFFILHLKSNKIYLQFNQQKKDATKQ
jgi:hypothetical protein